LLPLDTVPSRAAELDQVLRWQLRKSTPYAIEDAQISHVVASAKAGRTTMAAVVARRDVIAEYEAIPAALGVHAGVVDLASLNVMNAVVAAGAASPADWLLVHLAAEATTVAILQGADLLFYRHRSAVDEEPLGALVHQTAMYHEDRLGGSRFAAILVSGGGEAGASARAGIADRLGVDARVVDIRSAANLDVPDPPLDLLDALAAPVGLLVREGRAA
jgi:Tfp pilus assembly PilM family ATPase